MTLVGKQELSFEEAYHEVFKLKEKASFLPVGICFFCENEFNYIVIERELIPVIIETLQHVINCQDLIEEDECMVFKGIYCHYALDETEMDFMFQFKPITFDKNAEGYDLTECYIHYKKSTDEVRFYIKSHNYLWPTIPIELSDLTTILMSIYSK